MTLRYFFILNLQQLSGHIRGHTGEFQGAGQI
jgi:hypothetical protein